MKKEPMLVYMSSLNIIGGVETFCYEFCKSLSKDYDITFVYESADPSQLARIAEYVKVVAWTGQRLDTDFVVYASAWGSRGGNKLISTRGVYIQVIHGDYSHESLKGWQYAKMPQTTHQVCVSEASKRGFLKQYGNLGTEVSVIYNLLGEKPKVRKVMLWITVSRISHEKGFARMLVLAKGLKERNLPFLWLVFGSGVPTYEQNIKNTFKEIPEMVFMGSRLNVADYVAHADTLVQLSDTEGYPYSPLEALQLVTPCMVV